MYTGILSLSVAEQHTESPEEPRLQKVEEDAEVTVIFNPHSFSSQSPQPSTPATGAAAPITTSSSPNGRSGLKQKSRRGGGPRKQTGGSWKPERRQRERKESEEDDEEGMKRRVSEYLQAAQEEGEKRQVHS